MLINRAAPPTSKGFDTGGKENLIEPPESREGGRHIHVATGAVVAETRGGERLIASRRIEDVSLFALM